MIPGITAEGAITVALHAQGGTIARVSIVNQRPTAVRLLQGRPAAQAANLLPTFYALCRTAQRQAGIAAVERAAGLQPSPCQQRARRLLLLAETVLEHCMRALVDWPLLIGEAPAGDAARAARHLLADLSKRLYPHGDLPGGGLLSVDRADLLTDLDDVATLVGRHVFGGPALADLEAWVAAGATSAARLLASVADRGDEALGRCDVSPMPDGLGDEFDGALAADADGVFTARPSLAGQVFETGPLARQASHPLVVGLTSRHGNGLLPKLVARLVELDTALGEMRALAADLCDDAPHPVLPPVTGSGLGAVQAVRGLLVHRVELEEGRVARWQILAPTEWNFHPEGPLAKGLTGIPVEGAEESARLVVAALDPCVACQVAVV